jgi:chemosensory pili system protein ChpA (sensor histidine kinase/response regulator)
LGARFRIRLPLTLSIVEAMLLTAGGTLYAVPHGTALAVARVERARLTAGGDISIRYQDEDYRVLSLVSVLEARGSRCPHRPPPNRRWLPVLLVHAKEQRLALQVDSLIGSQRVMVKPIGPPLGALRWLSGGTLLPDGRVALLLDLTAVLRGGALPGSREGDGTLRMLLVNPSATATRLADALRGRTGVHLQTARGDAQVQERMQRALPDLILLDGDAPDEDAMDIAGRLRADERLQQVPILLVIGEADAALQGKALAAGIDRVLVAPVDEALLTAEVDTLLRAPRP